MDATPLARSLPGPLLLRSLSTHEDFAACVALQKMVWGEMFRDLVPAALLKVSQRIGGVVAGAFAACSTDLIGFVFGMTGWQERRPVHWSHMLAVHPDWRNRGVGRQLKELQRAELMAAGVESILWTYDPLVARNAHLNLNRLGVKVVEYVPDMYAPTGSSLHAIGMDRLVVHWDLTRPSLTCDALADVGRLVNENGAALDLSPADERIGIEIPSDIAAVQLHSAAAAMQWRATTRRAFLHYLALGYHVRGLRRDAAGRSYYVLEKS